MSKNWVFMVLLTVFFMSLISIKVKAADIDNCSDIVSSGTYTLTTDLEFADVQSPDFPSNACFLIEANDVILDCQGHMIKCDDHSGYGVFFDTISNTTVENCIFIGFSDGFYYRFGNNDLIQNNTLIQNVNGINLFHENNSTIRDNWINDSVTVGINDDSSTDDIFYNNYLNNTLNVASSSSDFWNITQQAGARIYSNGTYIGGNYWANPTGDDYSDTCVGNQYGFCDPYNVSGSEYDYLPLTLVSCTPSTACGNWSICAGNSQSRNCTDGCASNTTESQACVVPANYTALDENHTSYIRCIDNNTLYKMEWSNFDGYWHFKNDSMFCDEGCDPTTNSCAPLASSQIFYIIIAIIFICVFFAWFYKWVKK